MRLVIGNYNYSSWSLRAWLVARRAGIPFSEQRIALYQADSAAALREASPAGLVPVLDAGKVVVWDSLAIAEYFAEQVPALWPAEPAQRAQARSLCAEMHAGFAALRNEMPMNCRRAPAAIEVSDACRADIGRIDAYWSAAVGPWLFGDWSIADACFAPVALRFSTYAVELSAPARAYLESQLADPDLREWCARGVAETEIIETAEVA